MSVKNEAINVQNLVFKEDKKFGLRIDPPGLGNRWSLFSKMVSVRLENKISLQNYSTMFVMGLVG